uniref:DUF2332 family protein n=1 Tax=Pigmentiphaga litoralis TaxID=516702 RepID=UPI00389AE531
MQSATSEVYRIFADVEARGVSPVYFDWAASIAEDPDVLGLIESLPRHKRQPNLVFAAARLKGAAAAPTRSSVPGSSCTGPRWSLSSGNGPRRPMKPAGARCCCRC